MIQIQPCSQTIDSAENDDDEKFCNVDSRRLKRRNVDDPGDRINGSAKDVRNVKKFEFVRKVRIRTNKFIILQLVLFLLNTTVECHKMYPLV